MRLENTNLKQKIASGVFAISIVVGLFVLQAISISGNEQEQKPVKIYSAPVATQKTKVELKKEIRKNFSSNAVGSKQVVFDVELPTFSQSDIVVESVELVQNSLDSDFTIGGFQSAIKEDFGVEIFSIDMLDKTPKRLDKTIVEYPKRMLKLGVEGDVRLSVLILENGEVRVEKVLNSTNNFFSEKAISAASRFVYETPMRDGKPVKARFVLPIPFRIVK